MEMLSLSGFSELKLQVIGDRLKKLKKLREKMSPLT